MLLSKDLEWEKSKTPKIPDQGKDLPWRLIVPELFSLHTDTDIAPKVGVTKTIQGI